MTRASAARTTVKAAPGAGPRRRPESGGYARGDEVRSRILLAAVKLFGEQGFARASTRAIAAMAGVNPPALQYYFHNKERLHQACGQYIADLIQGHLREPMARAVEVIAAGDRTAVPDALWALMETVLDHSSNEAELPGWTRFLAQAAVEVEVGDTSLALIHRDAIEPLFHTLAALIALAWGRPAGDQAARLAAILLLGQAQAFGVNRQTSLSMMDWPDFADGRLEASKHCLKSLMMRLLETPLSA